MSVLVNNHDPRHLRQISPGAQGLTYLTVHGRRQALALDTSRG